MYCRARPATFSSSDSPVPLPAFAQTRTAMSRVPHEPRVPRGAAPALAPSGGTVHAAWWCAAHAVLSAAGACCAVVPRPCFLRPPGPALACTRACSRASLAGWAPSAALAFGTPAASEAGSIYGSMRGGSMFGSTRGSVTGHQHPSPAVQRAAEHSDRRSSPPVRPDPRDFGHSLNESAIAAAAEKTPVPVSPAFPGDQGSAHVANPTEEEIRRAVQADVAGKRVKTCSLHRTCLSWDESRDSLGLL